MEIKFSMFREQKKKETPFSIEHAYDSCDRSVEERSLSITFSY